MVQGGATGTDYSDQFIENIVKYIREKPDLVKKLQELLKDDGSFKNLNKGFDELSVEDVTELLKNNKEVLDKVVKHFTENKKDLEILLEQANKVKGMEGKLEALGNQLLTQGIISAATIVLLTGAVAGISTGALVGDGVILGLLALVAIAAIVIHRGEIKEGALDVGKAIKSFVKDLIDKLPTVQARENNFAKLKSDLLKQYYYSTKEEQIKLDNKIEIINMLQNEGQCSAIKELIKDGTIQNFLEDEMKKLIEKGDSTHVEDMDKLKDLMEKFLPEIMAIGGDIKEVEKKVNGKVCGMEPSSAIDSPSFEPLEDPEKTQSP